MKRLSVDTISKKNNVPRGRGNWSFDQAERQAMAKAFV